MLKDLLKTPFNLLASGVLTCLSNNEVQKALEVSGDHLPGAKVAIALSSAIVGAIAPSVLSKVTESITFEKVKSALYESESHPDKINHDLERLIAEAATRAVGFVKLLFIEQLTYSLVAGEVVDYTKEDIKSIGEVLDVMQEDMRGYFRGVSQGNRIIEDPVNSLTSIIDDLFIYTCSYQNEEHPIWERLRQFFNERLPLCFDLAFKESLKVDEKGRIAFQIWIWEDVQRVVKDNSEQLKQIKAEIEALGKGISKNDKRFKDEVSGILNIILDALKDLIKKVDKLNEKADEVLKGIGDLKTTIGQSIQQKPPKIIQNVDNELFSDPARAYFDAETVVSRSNRQSLGNDIKVSQKICIVGEPGFGKSFLARKTIYEIYLREKSLLEQEGKCYYDIIWWIDADTSNSKKVEDELIQLAKDEQMFGKDQINEWIDKNNEAGNYIGEDEVIKKLFEKLTKKSWLLVFDNAMDYDQGAILEENRKAIRLKFDTYRKDYLPPTKSDGHWILTSRNENWGIIEKPPILVKLYEWTDTDVKNYLEYIPQGSVYDLIVDVSLDKLTIFQGLPLAVAIAKAYMLDLDGEDKFMRFYADWHKKLDTIEHDFFDRNLLATVRLSYDRLSNNAKQLIDLLSCFAPDDLPISSVLKEHLDLIQERLSLQSIGLIKDLDRLKKLSLGRYDSNAELYSMHRLVQKCIRTLQGDAIDENYRLAISLLAKSFKKYSGQKSSDTTGFILSHIDTVAAIVRDEKSNLISEMDSNEERDEATKLFLDTGKYHFDVGDLDSAEKQFRTVIEVTTNQAAIATAKKSLANILFLRGKKGFDEAEKLAKEAAEYFEKQQDEVGYIGGMDDVIAKILQRKCLFRDSEEVSLSMRGRIDQYIAKIGSNDVFDHIIKKYENNESDKIAEKRGSNYHNLGSLYWTWGRKGDYEEASKYFKDAIEFQEKVVNALKSASEQCTDGRIKESLTKATDDRTFYLNVSRMIYGAVLGLLKDFDGQWVQHNLAFNDFNNRAKEKRRYAYTAYYKLSYSWDRESLGLGLPDGFNALELINDIERHEKVVASDEKYDLIRRIVDLRQAVRLEKNAEKAALAYDYLTKQLEAMKYEYGTDKQKVVRYYDVDTCSVSAILDYAILLKDNKRIKDSQEVAEYGLKVTRGIEYPRSEELETLAKGE